MNKEKQVNHLIELYILFHNISIHIDNPSLEFAELEFKNSTFLTMVI